MSMSMPSSSVLSHSESDLCFSDFDYFIGASGLYSSSSKDISINSIFKLMSCTLVLDVFKLFALVKFILKILDFTTNYIIL